MWTNHCVSKFWISRAAGGLSGDDFTTHLYQGQIEVVLYCFGEEMQMS